MGPARPAQEALPGRPGAGRGLQARRLSEARNPPRRERQAAAPPGRPSHHCGCLRPAAAAGQGAGGRPERHRGDLRSAAQACHAARHRGGRAAESVMAQLTDDCFAFSGPLLPIADMERLIAERVVAVIETETVPLTAARGRVLAADVTTPLDLPPFDNSAVDGYAVRHDDLDAKGETKLKITGPLFAGSAPSAPINPGQAVRIFTGAPMPRGADTVFMQEDTREESGVVIVPAGLKRGANRRLAGEDVRK